jgi:predicted PurR-regulated permease PerM
METKGTSIYRGIVAVAAGVIVFWGVQSLAFILAPLAIAMVITIAILPMPGWLTKKGLKPGLALIVTILTVVGVLALVGFVVIASLGKVAGLLPASQAASVTQSFPWNVVAPTATPAVTSATAVTPTVALPAGTTLTDLSDALGRATSQETVSGLAATVIIAVGSAVAQGFVVLFIFAFMLSAAFSLRSKDVAGFGAADPGISRVQEFTLEVRQYVNIMTVINFLVALGDMVVLVILGIPFAALWGILAFLMGFIPSIGWWISLIPPFLLAWSQYGLSRALIVLVAYVLINGGVQNIVQPRMMGKGLRMSPLVVFVSVIFWAVVLGGMGALIAVPMTLLVMKLLDNFDNTRWIAALMRVGSGAAEEGESAEEKQAFARLRGYAGKIRSAMPGGGDGGALPAP